MRGGNYLNLWAMSAWTRAFALAALGWAGCRGAAPPSVDPFADRASAKAPAADDGRLPGTALPASRDETVHSISGARPAYENEPETLWERTVKGVSPQEIKA